MSLKEKDIQYMQRALDLAQRGKGETSPNPMVGAVIVHNDKIIAEGWHKRCGGDHAEIVAFKNLSQSKKQALSQARLYINLEPCCHYGRTPPCVDDIIRRGIKEVVIAMKDPNPLVNGKSIRKLRQEGIKVRVGILEKEAKKLNESFIKYQTTGFPFVVAKCAQTLDGKIATATGDSQWITSEASRKFAHTMRDEFDAIMVGINTVLKDNPRLNGSRKKNFKKVILDSQLRISPHARLFAQVDPKNCFLVTTAKASVKKIKNFESRNINILVAPQMQGKIDLKWVMKELAKYQITSLLIEGGANVIGRALKQRIVDKMLIYIAPKIVGDQRALSSIVGLNTKDINHALQLTEVTHQKIGQDFLVTGYVHRNH